MMNGSLCLKDLALRSLVLAFALLAAPLGYAPAAHAVSKNVSMIKFDESVFDFGEAYRGDQLTHRFRFVNIGDGPLQIQGVHAACGCTAVEVDRGKVYQPGESGFVDIKLDTADFGGPLVKTVTVMTNERVMPDRTLTLRTFVKSEIDVLPPLADFGDASPQKGATQLITLKPLNGFKLDVGGVAFNDQALDVKTERQGDSYVLTVKLKDTLKPGFFKETLIVRNNSTHLKELPVPVRATIKGALETTPAYIEFGAIDPSAQAKRSVTISGANSFDIAGTRTELMVNGRKVDDADRMLKIIPTSEGPDRRQVAIELTNPARVPGAVHGKLFIKTTDPAQPEVAVDLYAFFR